MHFIDKKKKKKRKRKGIALSVEDNNNFLEHDGKSVIFLRHLAITSFFPFPRDEQLAPSGQVLPPKKRHKSVGRGRPRDVYKASD